LNYYDEEQKKLEAIKNYNEKIVSELSCFVKIAYPIISFLIPLFGIGVFISNYDSNPNLAKKNAFAAIFGIFFYFFLFSF